MNQRSKEFIEHVRGHLREHGYRLILGKGSSLNCGMGRCRGYFDPESKEIRVASKNDEMVSVLVHEYCHFLQNLELPKKWCEKSDDANSMVCDWLEGKEFDSKRLARAFGVVRWFERDCERRSVALIAKFGLNIDPILYIKKANLYLYYWHMVERRRKWNWCKRNNDIFDNKIVLKVMPTTFRFKSDQTVPKHIEELLERF